MLEGFVLNLAPTGIIPTKDMSPHVPLEPNEIIEQVLEGVELGVNMAHLHARDPSSKKQTHKKEHYAQIITGLRKHCPDLIICATTSGRAVPEFEKRSEVLDLEEDLKPDFASLTLSSLNFVTSASINAPQMICDLAKKMQDNGIRPELEVFDLGMINFSKALIAKGLITPPYYFNIILGNIAGAQANLHTLGAMVNELPENSIWSVGGIGRFQLTSHMMALSNGGGVRVGLEDNLWFDQGRTRKATNGDLIRRVLEIANLCERKPYPLPHLRKLVGLAP